MATEGYKRKISAIFSADVVDYSRLMEDDESATVHTIEAYRDTIIIAIKQHRGTVIDSPGDNILSEFASVVDAVQCAVETQQVIRAKNADLPENRKMQFRIGINLGDVIEEGERIYGDGVNLAVRIESIADPGSICISGSAYDQIKSKLALGYEDLGERSVKNISEPVRVYRIPMDSETGNAGIKMTGPKRLQWVALVLIGLITGAAAFTTWFYSLGPSSPTEEAAIAIVEKPSIAVLPFRNMSGDPAQEYFSEGISEDILNGLARNPGLDAIASTSSFQFKDKGQDVRDIGVQLSVTHVVEGSVRKSGNRIRVTAQLVNTNRGTHLWSQQYDRELTDVFEVQDEIAGAILNALDIHLLNPDEGLKQTGNMDAYHAYLLGRHLGNHWDLDGAVSSLKRAVSLDPDYEEAHVLLAAMHLGFAITGRQSTREIKPTILSHVNRALEVSSVNPDALSLKAYMSCVWDNEYQDAIYTLHGLLREHPNNTMVLPCYGSLLAIVSRFDLSFELFGRLVELDPLNKGSHNNFGTHVILSDRFKEVRRHYERVEALGMKIPDRYSQLAFLERDVEELQKQLDRGEPDWGGLYGRWYYFYRAALSYLKGDHESIREDLDRFGNSMDHVSYRARSYMASLEGDLDHAIELYSKALSESEQMAFIEIQAPLFRAIFPSYRSHPKYQKMLRDVGLDEESIAKLKIPPLPF